MPGVTSGSVLLAGHSRELNCPPASQLSCLWVCVIRMIDPQVMTTPFKEELALYVMGEVERAVKFDAVPGAAEF